MMKISEMWDTNFYHALVDEMQRARLIILKTQFIPNLGSTYIIWTDPFSMFCMGGEI